MIDINVVLCGMPMSGKTTIGKLLAEKIGFRFIDLDECIEEAYFEKTGIREKCRGIYKSIGEQAFRELEKQQFVRLSNLSQCVIAIGGGSLGSSEAKNIVASIGKVIYLKADIHELWDRIKWRGLPAYLDPADPKTSFEKLATLRTPAYEQVASFAIEIEQMRPEEIVSKILAKLA